LGLKIPSTFTQPSSGKSPHPKFKRTSLLAAIRRSVARLVGRKRHVNRTIASRAVFLS